MTKLTKRWVKYLIFKENLIKIYGAKKINNEIKIHHSSMQNGFILDKYPTPTNAKIHRP